MTFAIDGEITFRTAADRAAFAEELGVAVTRLAEKYHDGGSSAVAASSGGRRHRLIVALHPALKPSASNPSQTNSAKEQQDDD